MRLSPPLSIEQSFVCTVQTGIIKQLIIISFIFRDGLWKNPTPFISEA
jgi:hypothetical protein